MLAQRALGALKFSPKPFATATEFLKSDDKDLVRIGFSWLLAQDSARLAVGFREFLQDADADFRLPSLLWLSRRLERSGLEATLTSYQGNETYYYDVVTWLDRLVYAPQRLRESFARKLGEKAV